ncbi:hypothetical protein [Ralstonia soli]|uniref:Uncharacterized protein n=1 Tax=Ralstonia soli TaxID=2953896 RepID=A0ABT1ARS9_9RALS|nr:hypothetical protein [Ralstonia soli]MCO5400752.1 hypothetical protein [Ralstonia soli]
MENRAKPAASIIIALLCGLTATTAHAGGYGNETQKIELCRMVGAEAEIGFGNRGTPLPTNIDDETRNSWIGGIMTFAYNYGHDVAPNPRNAHMVAFGKCMDNLDHAAHRSPGSYMTEDEVRH